MNKQEILDALEALKDSTNHVGKQTIDGIKAAIMPLQEMNDVPADPIPVVPPLGDEEIDWTPLNTPEPKAAKKTKTPESKKIKKSHK